MKVTIRLHGQARQLTSTDRIALELPPGSSVDDLLPALLATAPPTLAELLSDPEGRLRRNVMAVLREEAIDPAAKDLLQENDELSLLPPMSGG